jgi:hypothetical protein
MEDITENYTDIATLFHPKGFFDSLRGVFKYYVLEISKCILVCLLLQSVLSV